MENDGPKNGINENGHKKVLSISIVLSINDVISLFKMDQLWGKI